jgi:hypothetical protein
LHRLAANTGKRDARLLIVWPRIGLPVWEAFTRLVRAPSMNGVERISTQEIAAYQDVYGVRFTRWELDMLAMFDAIAIEISNKT